MLDEILRVEELTKYFPIATGRFSNLFSKQQKFVHAVDGVNFSIRRGDIFGLVGETGSGKTTVGRLVLRLIEPDKGKIRFDGVDISSLNTKEFKKFRRDMHIIHQDPFSSLNPRKTVEDLVSLPLKMHGIKTGIREKTIKTLVEVGLIPEASLRKYPHEFSGGQRQRIAIARAIILRPKFIVADEPVTSLDISTRAQILLLLQKLQKELKLTYLLISHDLSVVRYISNFVAVMYAGKIVELAPTETLFAFPMHPYTKILISAVPVPDPFPTKKRIKLVGEMPNLINPPSGCRFFSRCQSKMPKCESVHPELVEIKKDHFVACHLY